jgi:hypothetical protein
LRAGRTVFLARSPDEAVARLRATAQSGAVLPRGVIPDCGARKRAPPSGLPAHSHGAGAGVGLRAAGELAVELGKQRHAVGELELGAGGGERGILSRLGDPTPSRAGGPPRSSVYERLVRFHYLRHRFILWHRGLVRCRQQRRRNNGRDVGRDTWEEHK